MGQSIVALEATGELEGSVLRDDVVTELQKFGREQVLKSYWNTREYGAYSVFDKDGQSLNVAVFGIQIGDTVVFRPTDIESFVDGLESVKEHEQEDLKDVLERIGIPFIVVDIIDSETDTSDFTDEQGVSS